MKKSIYLHTLAIVLALLMCVGLGWGLEWSEEVQMTHGGENYFDTRAHIGVAVDHNDVIHMAYTYFSYVDDNDRLGWQSVYQQFSKTGEPLIDPIVIGDIFHHNDDLAYAFDLCLDTDENVHILWGSDTLYHTMFANNGDPTIPGARLQGLLRNHSMDFCPPKLTIDSQGNLIYFGNTCTLWDPEEMRREEFISFGRYTFEGELIDTLHFLQVEPQLGRYPYVLCAPGDTLHFQWIDNITWLYSKVSPDDEILIDKQVITGEGDENHWFFDSNPVLDSNGNLNSITTNYNDVNNPEYLIQIAPDFQWNFQNYIGDNGFSGSTGRIWDGGDLGAYIVADTQLPPHEYQIVYGRFSYDGEIIDSMQCIRRSFLDGGGVIDWDSMSIIGFSDSTVAIIWDDNRFHDGNNGKEMFMRYSLPAVQEVVDKEPTGATEFRISSISPNPFNSTSTIGYSLPATGNVSLAVYDLSGREVARLADEVQAAGRHEAVWQANGMASGVYVVSLDAGGDVAREKVVLVR